MQKTMEKTTTTIAAVATISPLLPAWLTEANVWLTFIGAALGILWLTIKIIRDLPDAVGAIKNGLKKEQKNGVDS